MPTATSAAPVTFQGITVPAESVNPTAFYALTRRHRSQEYKAAFAGLGQTDNIELKKADIISGLKVRFSGTIVVTGTPKSTMQWPYGLIAALRFNANGQSNLINASGAAVKARAFMRPNATDRGVSQTVGTATKTQGTLSLASESWGVAAGATLAAGTYDVELEWDVPIAEDPRDLTGSIFAQTSTMDLTLSIDWAAASALTDTVADITVAGSVIVETTRYSIPVVGGQLVVPDLSMYHSIIGNRYTALADGDNRIRLAGQGAGKVLLRLYYRVLNGAGAAAVPLAATASNYGPQGWQYGSNETPEVYGDGLTLRQVNEDDYGSDIGGVFGWLCHEFNVENAFRDSIDMGQTSELSLFTNIASSVALASPVLEYVQETMFAAGS